MSYWGPVFMSVLLFILLSPGLLFQLPGKGRVVEFGTFQTSGVAILVHAIIYFAILLLAIENRISRQVTFAKHRNGLLKKAYELPVLCDAELRLCELSGTSCMSKTLERYKKCSYSTPEPAKVISRETPEYFDLKNLVEHLQRFQRNLMGEDSGGLDTPDLEKLESQLDSSLKCIRDIRIRSLLDKLHEVQNQEARLVDTNRNLWKMLSDYNQGEEPQIRDGSNNTVQPLECEPTLLIGYQNEQKNGNCSE